MSKEFKFAAGERVLCFHGPAPYEAKAQLAELKALRPGDSETPHYFVHYNGWSKKWDEWVPESRVLKYNDSNLQRQKELQRRLERGKKRGGAKDKADKGDAKEAGAQDSGTKRRRGRDDSVEAASQHGSVPEVKVIIPDELKHKLVDDWDNIVRQKKLMKLPRAKTVNNILADYCSHIASRGGRTQNITNEVASGLKVYFEQAIGTILLYQFERQQYDELLKEDPDMHPCDVFGVEHLLRLFVKLPGLLAHTAIEERNMAYLVASLQDILKLTHDDASRYITRNVAALFPADSYESVSPEYLDASK